MLDETRLWMGLNSPQLAMDDIHVGVLGAPYDGSVSHEPGGIITAMLGYIDLQEGLAYEL